MYLNTDGWAEFNRCQTIFQHQGKNNNFAPLTFPNIPILKAPHFPLLPLPLLTL